PSSVLDKMPHYFSALGPARARVEIAAVVVLGLPSGKARLEHLRVHAPSMMATLAEHLQAFVLECTRAHLCRSQEQESSFLIWRLLPLAIRSVPAFKRLFHKGHVQLVRAIIHPDSFADIRG